MRCERSGPVGGEGAAVCLVERGAAPVLACLRNRANGLPHSRTDAGLVRSDRSRPLRAGGGTRGAGGVARRPRPLSRDSKRGEGGREHGVAAFAVCSQGHKSGGKRQARPAVRSSGARLAGAARGELPRCDRHGHGHALAGSNCAAACCQLRGAGRPRACAKNVGPCPHTGARAWIAVSLGMGGKAAAAEQQGRVWSCGGAWQSRT
jgi:hypothetical protein